ncbi:MAG: hypothetical protein ACEY3D_04915 [Rickettsia sp.]
MDTVVKPRYDIGEIDSCNKVCSRS